jgi:hypothetical protein
MQRKMPEILVFAACLWFVAIACRLSLPAPSPSALPAAETQIPSTETPEPSATETLEPTLTPTPEPSATATSIPTETPSQTPDLAATAAYESTLAAEEVLARIGDVLPDYGLSLENGRLGWIGIEPVDIEVENFGAIFYEPIAEAQEFDNFLLHVDITWDSSSGLAGCGIIFRSERDLLNGEQYTLRTLRLSGLPAWTVEFWDFGAIRNTLKVEPNTAIRNDPGTTNNFVIVLEGTVMRLYANGTRLAGLTVNKRTTGRIAFLAWQESGVTNCLFDNAWIWELDD